MPISAGGSRKCFTRSQSFSVFWFWSSCSVGARDKIAELQIVRSLSEVSEFEFSDLTKRTSNLCESPVSPVTSLFVSPDVNGCDSGWQQYKNKCFKYIQTKMNYKNGVQLCSYHNATLTSVHSREELLFIEDIARRYSTASGVHWVSWLVEHLQRFEMCSL